MIATKAKHQLKNWDGFVGDIPNDVKMALKRESSLKNILGEHNDISKLTKIFAETVDNLIEKKINADCHVDKEAIDSLNQAARGDTK